MPSPQYVVKMPDGQYIGQWTISGPLEPVPAVFAYSYPSEQEAAAIASRFPGAKVATR